MSEIIWYLSFSDLFHLAYLQGPSMLLQMAGFHYFLWLSSIPLCMYTTSSFFIHPLMDT